MEVQIGMKIEIESNILRYYLRNVYFITGYHRVAIMLSSQSMSVDKFFDRNDADKQFLLEQINKAEDPEKTMINFKACIAKINSKEHYDEYANSGFFNLIRQETDKDTRDETLTVLAKHFQLDVK
jgi:hypothetical protein